MRFHVHGEGNSDVGTSEENQGPLMDAVRWVVGQVLETAPNVQVSYCFHTKTDLRNALSHKGGRLWFMPRADEDKETAIFCLQACALATLASKDPDGGAILFHDCDFTRKEVNPGQRKARYKAIVRAMERGFKMAGFKNGVPMVPRPRSESWLLCLCRQADAPGHAYFEELPGNDKAPNSGKKRLANALGCKEREIYDRLAQLSFDWARLQAPSFLFFAKRLRHVTERLAHLPCTSPEEETLMSEQLAH